MERNSGQRNGNLFSNSAKLIYGMCYHMYDDSNGHEETRWLYRRLHKFMEFYQWLLLLKTDCNRDCTIVPKLIWVIWSLLSGLARHHHLAFHEISHLQDGGNQILQDFVKFKMVVRRGQVAGATKEILHFTYEGAVMS